MMAVKEEVEIKPIVSGEKSAFIIEDYMDSKSQGEKFDYHEMANAIRFLSIDAIGAAKTGNPNLPMGMADVCTVLFKDFLKFYPEDPEWPDRDRFVLSAGHGSMLIYSLLYLTGYSDLTLDDIKEFRKPGSKAAGEFEANIKGIETAIGSLGQGSINAVGMALAEKI